MIFDFDLREQYAQSLTIADFGNTCIQGIDGEGNEHYLILKTVMGKTHILEFGPICPDIEMLVPTFKIYYSKMTYSEKKLFKEIDLFLNDKKKGLTEAKEIDIEEGLSYIPAISMAFLNSL